MGDEQTFFQDKDVTVTSARFVVKGQWFAMSDITSAKKFRAGKHWFLPILVMAVGWLQFCCSDRRLLAGLLAMLLGVIWLLGGRTTYHVKITTFGSEKSVLNSRQEEYIAEVVRALNDAIVARGKQGILGAAD